MCFVIKPFICQKKYNLKTDIITMNTTPDSSFFTPLFINKIDSSLITGIIIAKYDSTNNLSAEYNIKDGVSNGIQKQWYKNGQLETFFMTKNGIQNGVNKTWYENGQKQYESNFKEGKTVGLVKEWYKNGQIKYEYILKNDLLINSKCFDESGTKINCNSIFK